VDYGCERLAVGLGRAGCPERCSCSRALPCAERLFRDFLWTNSSSAILAETTLQVAPLVKERSMAACSVLRDQTA